MTQQAVEKSREISIVVVGGSYAGASAAKKLTGLSKKGYTGVKVTLIDQSTHYFHAVGFPKALVNPRYAEKAFLPFSAFFDTASRHEFVNAKLLRIVDNHHIEVTGGKQIYFDYLVVATGGQSPGPINITGCNKEQGVAEIAKLREGLENARSVLVIGGGPAGVEIAGSVADTYPDKKVTLVHSGSRLLPLNFCETLGAGAKAKLESIGVSVVLNERIELPSDFAYASEIGSRVLKGASGNEYESDAQILAVGFQVHAEFFNPLEQELGQTLRTDKGFVRVKPTLQVDCDMLPNIFVAGDVSNLPVTTKYGFKAEMQGSTAADNIKKLIDAGLDSMTRQDTAPVPGLSKWVDYVDATLVPIGSQLGVAQLLKIPFGQSAIGNFLVRNLKTKDFMLWLRKGYFRFKDSSE
ncbi:hypothetical protein GGI25_003625 [Coemansia spiralis]|uniref:FAD/NAD(P)-binding domain-containing protein n=2 Tax=Coemansia TaxID=4863 RepID=A0A9W8G1Q2_9FUNG|nr:hypothetical protein BX070DRAFT_251162 [Coemansia spiralis]KAJ1996148.1 hypothetical protein EDC05_000038 [Coemansia umbellata]KAJ2626095.1 hypothetical protein GGI26_000179 [Coemansia sp. RSA 1358]KAJ2676238.1 hypothetical protein GGI25_003625 [Coemansia spiralis]